MSTLFTVIVLGSASTFMWYLFFKYRKALALLSEASYLLNKFYNAGEYGNSEENKQRYKQWLDEATKL